MKFLLNLFSKTMPFYSVARGRKTGVFSTWPACEAQVKGFTSPIFRKFTTYDEAVKFVISKGGTMDNDIRKDLSSTDLPTATDDKFSEMLILSESDIKSKSEKRSNDDSEESTSSKKRKKNDGAAIPLKRLKKYGNLSFFEDDDGFVHVYTDGSCEGNGTDNAVAGLGVYFGEGHSLNMAKPVSGRATNNCGEIQAATMAIKLAGDCGISKLCINTDSQFVINAITKWMAAWKRNNWRLKTGQPVKNVSDFKSYEKISSKYDINIKWNYVKAHCGILGNERADALAKQGGEMYRSGLRN